MDHSRVNRRHGRDHHEHQHPAEECQEDGKPPALDVTVNSAGTTEHSLQPGEYTLFVNVLEKTTGNIMLSAK